MPLAPELSEKMRRLPRSPGVYLMRGHDGVVFYVGKATDLRSRVRSYFSGSDPRPFVASLDRLLGDLDVVVTSNAKEALLLENTLIKKHRPRFNIMLRDDKNYLSLRIDERHPWPRVDLVRSIRSDGATYFGPYHSAQSVRRTLAVVNRHFRLRTCSDKTLNNRSRPCLQYQIKRCPAPCVLDIDRAAYLDDVHHAKLFLSGREDELLAAVRTKMERAAEDLEFEEAARFRDQLEAIERSLQAQAAVQTKLVDQDVIGVFREADAVAVAMLTFREGSMTDVSTFGHTDQPAGDGAVISTVLAQRYGDDASTPPKEILVSHRPDDLDALEEALSELRGTRCRVLVPERGDKRRLVELAVENARTWYAEHLSAAARSEEILAELARRLHLTQIPRTIECFDISNFQGTEIVASQVHFRDAEPDKDRYRKYRVRSVRGQDDFASLFEVLSRRSKRALSGEEPMPDLLVIDGGKGQLGQVIAALQDLGLHDQEVVALAKSRVTGRDDDDATTRSMERVFLPGQKNPVLLKPHNKETHLLSRLRDEAHRVAIEYHRSLRRRRTLRSGLDDIPGIGPSRRGVLLRHFGSLAKVKDADLGDLERVPGFSRHLAFRVFDHFHPGEADAPSDEE